MYYTKKYISTPDIKFVWIRSWQSEMDINICLKSQHCTGISITGVLIKCIEIKCLKHIYKLKLNVDSVDIFHFAMCTSV